MSTHSRGKKKRSRGSILLLSIFFLIILFSLAVTFFRVIPAEFHSATQARRMVQAQYAADAGVREAVAWLKTQEFVDDDALETFSDSHDDATVAAQRVDAEWSYTVSITTRDPVLKIYDIVATAFYRDRPEGVREIRTTVRNETFAKYALFYDTWGPDFLFTMGANSIQGPFHTNDYFHLAAPSASFWTDGKAPFVNGAKAEMTHADEMPSALNTMSGGDGNMYYGGNYAGTDEGLTPHSADGTANADRYKKIVDGGREKLQKVDKVKFPEAVAEFRALAWGDTPPADLSATVAAKGPLLVNTNAGPNAPDGKLKGGMLYASDAKSVQLEITEGNGNHQKTKITDKSDTLIKGGGATTYKYDEKIYRALVPQPDKKVTTKGPCLTTKEVPTYTKVNQPKDVTGPHPDCGQETIFIPGSGGVSTPIKVDKSCTRTIDPNWVNVQTGTKTTCTKYGPSTVTMVPVPPKWTDVPADYTGAQHYKTNVKTTSDPNFPGVYGPTVGDLSLATVNSVVEVNDANYVIPYHPGMKINGEVQTSEADSLAKRTVVDGNTVHIKNDISVNGTNFAEYTVMEGRINGVTFSDGDLKDVQGTVKGSKHADKNGNNIDYRGRTISTDIQANKSVEISGSILQYYDGNLKDGKGNALKNSKNQLIPGNPSPNADHILGIVAYNISLKQPTGTKSSAFNMARNTDGTVKNDDYTKGFNVYGVLMAGRQLANGDVEGGFGSDGESMQSDDGLGDFNLFGGIISGNARSTQTGFSNGNSSGFRMNLNYDEIAALNLENFPTTNNYSIARYVNIGTGNLDEGFGSYKK